MTPTANPRPHRSPALAWQWIDAALGATYALPAGIVAAFDDPARGLALSVGVLPAAMVGLPPTRKGRLALILLGVLTGVPMLVGGLLSGVPVVAVAAIALLGVGAVLLARRFKMGQVAMTLALPMVGVGLSYDDIGQAAELAALMVAGSVFAAAVSMAWPQGAAAPRPAAGPRPAPPTLEYGVRLGAAGATAAAIGFLLDLEHVGWACAAALLVMRPSADMQRLRSAGRILAVAAGALLAIALVRLQPADLWYGVAAIAAVAGAAATHRSRWYLTSAFTTFLVFLLLLYSAPQDAAARFGERFLETLLGVGLAYAYGLALPRLTQRLRSSHPRMSSGT